MHVKFEARAADFGSCTEKDFFMSTPHCSVSSSHLQSLPCRREGVGRRIPVEEEIKKKLRRDFPMSDIYQGKRQTRTGWSANPESMITESILRLRVRRRVRCTTKSSLK